MPTRRRPLARAQDTTVAIPIDARLARLWKTELARLTAASHAGASAFDTRYEAVAAIVAHDPPLYLAGGCATFAEFCTRFAHEDERTVRRWMRVAKFATPAEEERFTPSKLDAVLHLLDAMTGHAVTGRLPVRFDALRVPVVRKGRATTVALDDATVKDVQAATRRALHGATHAAPAAAAAKAVTDALGGGPLAEVSVRFTDGQFAFGHVPAYALGDFAKALKGVSLPADAAAKKRARPTGNVAGKAGNVAGRARRAGK